MANYTEHYQLHQWEPEDSFLRTDFNEDFAKLTGAGREGRTVCGGWRRAGCREIRAGNGELYRDGEASRTIELGFPQGRYCAGLGSGPINYTSSRYGGLALEGRGKRTGNPPRRAGSPRRYRGFGILRL